MPRMTLDLSDEIDDTLTALARRRGITKAEAMRKAFALLVIADTEARKPGFSLGIVRERDDHTLEAVGRVVGLRWTSPTLTWPRCSPNRVGVSLNEGERLCFARQVLLGLGLICFGVFVAHGMVPDNPGVSQIFELMKIGALPLVTLVISLYFPNSSTK